MPEPHATTATGAGLVAFAVAAVGPLLGPYLIIALAAFGGAFVAITMRPTRSIWQALAILGRGMVVALVATGLVAYLTSLAVPGLTAEHWLVPLAFVIGLQPEGAIERLRRLLGHKEGEQ